VKSTLFIIFGLFYYYSGKFKKVKKYCLRASREKRNVECVCAFEWQVCSSFRREREQKRMWTHQLIQLIRCADTTTTTLTSQTGVSRKAEQNKTKEISKIFLLILQDDDIRDKFVVRSTFSWNVVVKSRRTSKSEAVRNGWWRRSNNSAESSWRHIRWSLQVPIWPTFYEQLFYTK